MTGCVPTPCLQALLELEAAPRLTGVCVLADKEEIGSLGVTGMQSAAFDIFMERSVRQPGGRPERPATRMPSASPQT